MKTISRFTYEEAAEIQDLLRAEKIPFECHGVDIYVGVIGGKTEYVFHVSDECFLRTLDLTKSYFCISPCEVELYSGSCPACSSIVTDASECPECGLALVGSSDPDLKEHPFYIFLEQQGLVE